MEKGLFWTLRGVKSNGTLLPFGWFLTRWDAIQWSTNFKGLINEYFHEGLIFKYDPYYGSIS